MMQQKKKKKRVNGKGNVPDVLDYVYARFMDNLVVPWHINSISTILSVNHYTIIWLYARPHLFPICEDFWNYAIVFFCLISCEEICLGCIWLERFGPKNFKSIVNKLIWLLWMDFLTKDSKSLALNLKY